MISLIQMKKYTPAKIKYRTIKTVKSIRTIKAVYDTDERGLHKKALFRVVATTIPRKVQVKLYGSGNQLEKKKTWVHCSCEWFTFFCEYALAMKRSSAIINCNGEPPIVNNPRQWPYVCKHIIAVFNRLPKIKFKMPKVKPTEEELEYFMQEIEKYIPGT